MTYYYEAHITLEPLFDEQHEELVTICSHYGFHVAELLMRRRQNDLPERSRDDSFATGRSKTLEDLKGRMLALMDELTRQGFVIWRYKIEDTVLDSRYGDETWPLDRSRLPDKELNPRPAV